MIIGICIKYDDDERIGCFTKQIMLCSLRYNVNVNNFFLLLFRLDSNYSSGDYYADDDVLPDEVVFENKMESR